MSKKTVINGEVYEIEEEHPTVTFFKEPIEKLEVEKCKVDEAYLSAYEEMKADEKIIKDNLEIMNGAIKAAVMPGEKTLTLGKMVAFFTEVDGKPKVDWEALAKAELGNDKGEIDREIVARFTTPAKSQTRLQVKRLG